MQKKTTFGYISATNKDIDFKFVVKVPEVYSHNILLREVIQNFFNSDYI